MVLLDLVDLCIARLRTAGMIEIFFFLFLPVSPSQLLLCILVLVVQLRTAASCTASCVQLPVQLRTASRVQLLVDKASALPTGLLDL
eukprot:COSAG05_NODE_82_length_20915_cov_5.306399_15_plen_87_part_00